MASPAERDPETERARRYYDEFAPSYEARRDGRSRYHDLLDDLELELASPYVSGREVLEVGCGTGLLLRRLATVARRAVGVDLSPAMLARARARGLECVEGSATALPFPDQAFDVVVSFKTLPHVPDLAGAFSEMRRVVRPGGVIVAELYNRRSLRALAKRIGPAGRVGAGTERDVYLRFDDRASVERALPSACRIERVRGIRTVVPAAALLEVPVLSRLFEATERALCDRALAQRYGGFLVFVVRA